jgi:transcriptional regulator with XRE-family HTH domain
MAFSFSSSKIFLDSETVAEKLRSARQARKLKLSAVAEKLNIREKYLAALEKSQYNKLPQGVYGKNFLREYAIFLKLDHKKLSEDFDHELALAGERLSRKKIFSNQKAKKIYFLAIPKIIRGIFIFFIALAGFLYLWHALSLVAAPPHLEIFYPPENFITNSLKIEIKGKTDLEALVSINNESVLADAAGNFSQEIDLKTGINTITISASKKYGRKNLVKRQILVRE